MDVEHEEIAGDASVGSLEALVRRITEKPSKSYKDIDGDDAAALPGPARIALGRPRLPAQFSPRCRSMRGALQS